MYIYSVLGHKGVKPSDIDVDLIIDEIRKTGRADLVLKNYSISQ